jgi:tetratricopeptide (TPR) repeat protein
MRSALKYAMSILKPIKECILAVVAIIVFSYFVVIAWAEFRSSDIIIESISLPKAISEKGYTEEITAHLIADSLWNVSKAARTTKGLSNFVSKSSYADITIPQTAISLRSMVQQFRQMTGWYVTRINGDVVCEELSCKSSIFYIQLRITHEDRLTNVRLKFDNEKGDKYNFDKMAKEILTIIDPYTVAAYVYSEQKDADEAKRIAKTMIEANSKEVKWAYNLIGAIYERKAGAEQANEHSQNVSEYYESAKKYYNHALIEDDKFVVPRLNLADIELKLQNYGVAMEYYEKAFAIGWERAEEYYRWIEAIKKWIEVKNNKKWTEIMGEKGAMLDVERALSNHLKYADKYKELIKKGNFEARDSNQLGEFLFASGNIEEAIRFYTRTLAIDEEYYQSYHNLHLVSCLRKDIRGAQENFAKAVSLRQNKNVRGKGLGELIVDVVKPACGVEEKLTDLKQ